MRSPNDEGSQFSKLHFPCNKEERLVLNSFFREYKTQKDKQCGLSAITILPIASW